eukprot:scaffold429275_cov17-Prasinocladus_malaysianus.AAC.1
MPVVTAAQSRLNYLSALGASVSWGLDERERAATNAFPRVSSFGKPHPARLMLPGTQRRFGGGAGHASSRTHVRAQVRCLRCSSRRRHNAASSFTIPI